LGLGSLALCNVFDHGKVAAVGFTFLPHGNDGQVHPDDGPIRPDVTLLHGKAVNLARNKPAHVVHIFLEIIRVCNGLEIDLQHFLVRETDDFTVFEIGLQIVACDGIG